MALTTERFFASAAYMNYSGKAWSELRDSVDYDNLNQGVDSLFNHFSTFSYSSNILEKYEPSAHFVGYSFRATTKQNTDTVRDSINKIAAEDADIVKEKPSSAEFLAERLGQGRINAGNIQVQSAANQKFVTNPTAQTIINWSANSSSSSILGYSPYAWTDFGFCKYYGKVPNNRLITLRRYPFPVGDRLKSPNGADLIPIAQAVTWFGTETGNKLSKIGNFQWNMPWFELPVTQQDIGGNEVTIDDLAGIVSGLGGAGGAAIAEALKAAVATSMVLNGNTNTMAEVSGTDVKLRDYVKEAYNKDTGPFWNRVYGPVNVIHKSTRRDRGMQDQYAAPFVVDFHYQFRSFSGLSPKMVALDLISNFLQLTYNNAQFLGQLTRYFQKPGLKFSKTVTETLTELLLGWASGKIPAADALKSIYTLTTAAGVAVKKDVEKVIETAGSGDLKKAITGLGTTAATAASVYAAMKAGALIPNLISAKSALSDRPVGEWHLVVGNPINPIFVMGDLLVSNCVAKFDEEIGPDDFPTGITFSVSLRQGKPKDKFAIERMFNSGLVGLGFTNIKTSSAEDTFGSENDARYKATYGPSDPEQRKAAVNALAGKSSSFSRARDRVGLAYGYRQTVKDANGNTTKISEVDGTFVDDSLLALYYKKDFGSQ